MRTRLWTVAACVALSAALGTTTIAAADPGASAAKKKSAKQAKKQAKRFLQGSSWNNVTASSTGTSSSTTAITFCPNGTYSFVRNDESIVAASQTSFDGQWSVQAANPKKASAKIKYTVQNFRSVYFDGSPTGQAAPPSPSILNAFADSESRAFFDGTEFNRGAAGC